MYVQVYDISMHICTQMSSVSLLVYIQNVLLMHIRMMGGGYTGGAYKRVCRVCLLDVNCMHIRTEHGKQLCGWCMRIATYS